MIKRTVFGVSTRISFVIAGVLLVGSSPAWALAGFGDGDGRAANGGSVERSAIDSDAERNQATEAVLDSLQLDFPYGDHRPLKQVLGELTGQTGLRFVLDPSAEDGDLTRETEIEFSAESIRCRTGLEMMLGRFNSTYVIRDGIVVIVSLEAASDPHYFRRKMFDVESLLQLVIRTQGIKDRVYMVPAEMVQPPSHRDGFGRTVIDNGCEPGLIGGGGMFALPLIRQEADLTPHAQVGGTAADADEAAAKEPAEIATEAQEPAVAKPAGGNAAAPPERQSTIGLAKLVPVKYTARQIAGERLIDLVQTQVCPDEWFDTGNGDGVIQVVGGVLVVSQTEDALYQVGSMLRELEVKLNAIDARANQK